MKISEQEAKVLVVLESGSAASVREVSALTGYKESLIRSIVDRARRAELIKPVCDINFKGLGLKEYRVYLRLRRSLKTKKDLILKALLKESDILKVSEYSGDFDFSISILGQDIERVAEILSCLAGEMGSIFDCKAITIPIKKSFFGKRYLSNLAVTTEGPFPNKSGAYIDDLDEMLLTELYKDASLNGRDLMQRTGMNQRVVNSKLNSLKELGVLKKRYEISAKCLQRFETRILIDVRNHMETFKKSFFRFLVNEMAVTEVSECLGACDYSLKLEFLRAADEMNFIDSIFQNFGEDISGISCFGLINSIRGEAFKLDSFKSSPRHFADSIIKT